MTRAQRRVHLMVWLALALLLPAVIAVSLAIRPTPTAGSPAQ